MQYFDISNGVSKNLINKLWNISSFYRYSRKCAILRWCDKIAENTMTLTSIKQLIRYLKKLQSELADNMNEKQFFFDLLEETICILNNLEERNSSKRSRV